MLNLAPNWSGDVRLEKNELSNSRNVFGVNLRYLKLSELYLIEETNQQQRCEINYREYRNIKFGTRKTDGNQVVIKMFEKEENQAILELATLVQLQQYDFVVKVIDYFYPISEDWNSYKLAIVFERLEELPRPYDMTIDQIVSISKQLLQMLSILHDKQRLIHMDIKPSNLMKKKNVQIVENNNLELKLIDFGLCTPYFENTQFPNAGTINFMAPELNDGN